MGRFTDWMEKRPPRRQPLQIELEVFVIVPWPLALLAWVLRR